MAQRADRNTNRGVERDKSVPTPAPAPAPAPGSAPGSAPTPGPGGDGARAEQDAASARRAELDAILIETIRNGTSAGERQAAWTELLEAHEDRIFATCLRMVRDYETARDLTQDSMVKVIQGLDSFDNRARFSTWLTRVSMNVCISYMRKRRLRRHASLDAPMGGSEGGGGPGAGSGRGASFSDALESPEEHNAQERVEQREDREMLLAALDLLDPDHRAVLVLRDAQDLDYQQIGDVLGVPLGTVKSRLFRARAALREAIEKLQSQTTEGLERSDDEGRTSGSDAP